MKICVLAFILFIVSLNSYSQLSKINDSLVAEICKSLIEDKEGADTARVFRSFRQHLIPVLALVDSSDRFEAYARIELRLQRNCAEFKDISDRLSVRKGDWARVPLKPSSLLSHAKCQEFFQFEEYFYLEESGDTVHLTIKDGIWEDHFKDGTFSRLKVDKMTNCEFEIVFIESNNLLRKSFSYPGDRYRYQILERFDNHYKFSVQVSNRNEYMTSNMYYR